MNENPEGTPNPLNPNPSVAPVGQNPVPMDTSPQPAPQPAPQPVGAPTSAPQPAPAPMPTQAPEPTPEPAPAVAEAAVALETMEAVADQGTIKTPEKKSKRTGLVLVIIFLVLAITAGVAAAIVLLNPFGQAKDAVPTAIAKLLSNDAPKVVSIVGTINLTADATAASYSPVASLAINFTAGIDSKTTENYADATIIATFTDNSKFSFNVDEVHVTSGDLYLKLSNIAEALDNYTPISGTTTIDPTYSILDYLSVFEAIDGEWIRIPNSGFSNLTDVASLDTPTQCLIDATGNLAEYGTDFVKMYNSYPFINYSTENLKIAQKKDTLYRLNFDTTNLTNFINSMSNSGFANELIACMGGQAVVSEVSTEAVQQIVSYLPTIYVEINKDNDFSRVYLSTSTEDGSVSVIADLSFTYPSNISIEEPSVYVEINEVISRLLNNLYDTDVTNVIDITDATEIIEQ